MPKKKTIERAEEDKREGESPSTQTGEFVHEEMHHIREGKHGARSTKQAIASGLSKARRAGVVLNAPKKGAARPSQGRIKRNRRPSPTRFRAKSQTLKGEGHSTASNKNLGRQVRRAASARGPASRHESATKAVRTKLKAQVAEPSSEKGGEDAGSERRIA